MTDQSAFPVSYKDPAYDQADQQAAAANGIPVAMLSAIRTKGERSNADQVSSAGAQTPYQITPETRQSIIDQTGVDPYLNPQTAAYGAAYLLKQNLDRNSGNPVLAVANYIGGTNPSNWGPQTMAYTKRVTGFTPKSYVPGQSPNPFALQAAPDVGTAPGAIGQASSASAASGDPYALQPAPQIGSAPGSVQSGGGSSPLQQIYQAYQGGKMSPEDAAQFEWDVSAGRIVLPAGSSVKTPPPTPEQPKIMEIAPQPIIDAFNKGQMTPEDAAQFQKDVDAGNIALPPGVELNPPQAGAGRTAGVAARGYIEGLGQGTGGLIDRAKGIIDAPVNALNMIAQGGILPVVDRAFGTHFSGESPIPTKQTGIGATQLGNAIPNMEEGAQAAADKLGLPVAQTPGEQIVQAGARGAGLMTQPFPGMTLAHLPQAIAAGAAGAAVGEKVHQQTGSQALGMAANLLTTALSPLAASRVMKALVGEIGARGAQTAAAGEAAAQQAPAAESDTQTVATAEPTAADAPSSPTNLATQPNPGTPEVTNPQVAALQAEKESLIPVAANAPSKGDTAIPDQLSALESRQFDSVADRTRALQAQGMKFSAARANAEKQIISEMDAHQSAIARLQNQLAQSQEASRATQRIQEIDNQISRMAPTAPAQRTAISQAVGGAFEPQRAAPVASAPIPTTQSTANAAAQESAPQAVTSTPEAAQSATVPAESAAGSSVNPTASPLADAAKDFILSDELAAQMRKAVGVSGSVFGSGKQTAQQILASQMAPDSERLAAANRLGIADNLQPDHLTTNQAAIELAQAIKSTPGSLARAEEMQGLQRVAQRGQKIVEDAGGMTDLSELSASVRNDLMTTQQQLDQKADALYSEIKQSVPAKMAAPAQNVLSFIGQRADDLGGIKNLSSTERMILGKLSPKEVPMTVGGQEIDPRTLGMEPQYQQPSYALLDDVRRDIGNGLRNQGPFKDADTGLLKALYGRLAEDQRSALGTVPGMLEKFDTARATVQMRKSIEDDMTSLFGKQLGDSIVGKLGTAISALPKGDETKFVSIIKAVPPNMRQQVTASGIAYAFGKATKNGELNFKTFADWWDGLMKNSKGANAVLANLPPESRQQLADLAKVSRGISNATREVITTGRIMAAREELNQHADGLLAKVMGTAKQAAIGHIGTAAASAGAAVAGPAGAAVGSGIGRAVMSALSRGKPDVMKAADELIVSPEFQAVAKSGNASEAAIKAAANSPKFRRFYDLARGATKAAANDPVSREQWLRGLMSAAGQQALENKR